MKLPEVPVIVTVAVPVVAVPLAVSVSVLVVVAEVGLNAAVTPLGKPDADKLTLPLKPFTGLTVTVSVPLAPCVILTLFVDADRLKSGAAFTVRLTVVVCVRLPDALVIVTVLVPVAAALLAVNVRELVLVVEVGVKVAVTPLGKPDAVRATLPVKPFWGVIVIVSALLVLP